MGRLELRLIVRIPIIPGKNDDENNVRATASFLRAQSHVDSIELIPYNRLAESKYTRFGLRYLLNGLQSPGVERMVEIEECWQPQAGRSGPSGACAQHPRRLCPMSDSVNNEEIIVEELA